MRTGSRPRRRRTPALAALLAVAVGAPLLAGSERLVIVQPGYPGSTEEAREFVAGLVKFVGEHGGPSIAAGEYHNTEKGALEAIRRDRPTLGIVSLAFYLEHADALGLEPVLSSRPDEPFHIAVKSGRYTDLADLAGKTVTGTPLVEDRLVRRLLMAGADGKPVTPTFATWKLEPVKYFSKGIRDVTRDRKDAVILSHREYRGMKRLRSARELSVIHTTPAFPTAVVVTIGKPARREKLAADLARALAALEKTEKGREILETMGISGFAPLDTARLESLEARYERGAHGARDSAGARGASGTSEETPGS